MQKPKPRFEVLAIGVFVLVSAVILMGALAPTTDGLILQTTSHTGSALPSNRNEAAVFLSAYNAAGSIRGLVTGSFNVSVLAAPENASPIKKVAVTEPTSGVYRISFQPELSSQKWVAGKYVIAISLTSANGSGVVLADLVIGQ